MLTRPYIHSLCTRAYEHTDTQFTNTCTHKHYYVLIQTHRRCITQTHKIILVSKCKYTYVHISIHVCTHTQFIQSFKHSRKYSRAHLKIDLLGYCVYKFQNQ